VLTAETDRPTDRRTHDHSIYRASIASRGKNWTTKRQPAWYRYITSCRACARVHVK